MASETDTLKFDGSQLLTALKIAQQIIDSSISLSSTPTQLSNSPPPSISQPVHGKPKQQLQGKSYAFQCWFITNEYRNETSQI